MTGRAVWRIFEADVFRAVSRFLIFFWLDFLFGSGLAQIEVIANVATPLHLFTFWKALAAASSEAKLPAGRSEKTEEFFSGRK